MLTQHGLAPYTPGQKELHIAPEKVIVCACLRVCARLALYRNKKGGRSMWV